MAQSLWRSLWVICLKEALSFGVLRKNGVETLDQFVFVRVLSIDAMLRRGAKRDGHGRQKLMRVNNTCPLSKNARRKKKPACGIKEMKYPTKNQNQAPPRITEQRQSEGGAILIIPRKQSVKSVRGLNRGNE